MKRFIQATMKELKGFPFSSFSLLTSELASQFVERFIEDVMYAQKKRG